MVSTWQGYASEYILNISNYVFLDIKPTVMSGFKGLRILKITNSSLKNFTDDQFRTTPEIQNHFLSTIAECAWLYTDIENIHFKQVWEKVRDTVMSAFAGDAAVDTTFNMIQRSVYLSVRKVLDDLPCKLSLNDSIRLINRDENIVFFSRD